MIRHRIVACIRFIEPKGSKRVFARLEGHDDAKNLNPWSQFFAAGLGGIISQSVSSLREKVIPANNHQVCRLSSRYSKIVRRSTPTIPLSH